MEVNYGDNHIKEYPDSTYKTLKKLAAEHHRSRNSEIIHLIEKATKSNKIDPNQHLLWRGHYDKKQKNICLPTTRFPR